MFDLPPDIYSEPEPEPESESESEPEYDYIPVYIMYCYMSKKQLDSTRTLFIYENIDLDKEEHTDYDIRGIKCSEVSRLRPEVFLKETYWKDMKYVGRTSKEKGFRDRIRSLL